MNPLLIVAGAVLLTGAGRKKKKKNQQLKTDGKEPAKGVKPAAQPGMGRIRPRGKTKIRSRRRKAAPHQSQMRNHRRNRNGKARERWTSFPWQPHRVTQVAEELIAKGETDPDKVTLATAKTVYPIHPLSGAHFEWPPQADENGLADAGATMIWERIRLRVNTLIAADEERVADQATEHVPEDDLVQTTAEEVSATDEELQEAEEESAEEEGEGHAEPDAENEDDDEERVASPRIGRISPTRIPESPKAQQAVRRRRPFTMKGMQRRPRPIQVDPYAFHPADNLVRDGVFHKVQDKETIHYLAACCLDHLMENPSGEQVAHYVSLIVSSPYNVDIEMKWDDEHDLPGADPYPWGIGRPVIWLPKLNEQKLQEDGVVTTHGVTWADGSNGITPPPGMMGREDDA